MACVSCAVGWLQELMVEHGMRAACVAAFNPDCLHELMTSNMETGGPAGPTTVDNWRAIAVSCLSATCLLFPFAM